MAQTDYDVLIIGSGAGGGAALWRLCEQWGQNGKRIGMIEAGDLLLPTHAFHIPTFDEQRALEYWERVSDPVGNRWPDFRSAKIVRGLGGRTLIWYGWSPRFDPAAFRTWPITYKDLAPYYLIAEKIMNVTTNYTKGSALQEILIKRLLTGGFPEARDVPLATDLEGTKYGQVHSNVYFSSIDFLAYALNIRKFDLAVNTRAVQILTEQGKAVGVKVMTSDKKTYTLTAKTIVVSASTWETPRLLLNSNIPGEAIGKYLAFHPVYEGNGTVDRDVFPEVFGVATVFVPGTADEIISSRSSPIIGTTIKKNLFRKKSLWKYTLTESWNRGRTITSALIRFIGMLTAYLILTYSFPTARRIRHFFVTCTLPCQPSPPQRDYRWRARSSCVSPEKTIMRREHAEWG